VRDPARAAGQGRSRRFLRSDDGFRLSGSGEAAAVRTSACWAWLPAFKRGVVLTLLVAAAAGLIIALAGGPLPH